MKVTAVKTHIVGLRFRNCIFTRIETDEGLTGISEVVLRRHSRAVEQSIQEHARRLLGQDPTPIEDIWEKLYRDSFWVGGPQHATAISALDVALWDLAGKRLGVPVYRLLGGPTRPTVPIYAHAACGSTPEEFVANIRARLAQGLRAVKTTLPLLYGAARQVPVSGGRPAGADGYSGTAGTVGRHWRETELAPAGWLRDVREFFAAARRELGFQFDIAVDCHGRLSPAAAIRVSDLLADLDILFIEEPIPPEDPEALARVARASRVPIAAGERIATIYGARPFLEKGAVAVLQCDVANCGGLTQAKKIAALAEAHYVSMAPHNPNGPVATAAAVHLAAAIPNFLILETVGSPEDFASHQEITRGTLLPADGVLPLPTGPGLGIELVPEAFDRYPYQPFDGYR